MKSRLSGWPRTLTQDFPGSPGGQGGPVGQGDPGGPGSPTELHAQVGLGNQSGPGGQGGQGAYLIFVIFLHWQNFWSIKFTPKYANFSR